jgi:hypothetical protein
MARSRDWKSEYRVEYIRWYPDASGSRRTAHTHVIPNRPKKGGSATISSAGAITRSRRAEGIAQVTDPEPIDYGNTEYTTEYVDPGQGQTMGIVKHPDHDDMFHWRKPRAAKSSYTAAHDFGTTVHDPSYSTTSDYSYGRPDPDLTKFRRLEQQVDVNPFRTQFRPSQEFQSNSTYREEFVSYFPTMSEAERRRAGQRPTTGTGRTVTFGTPVERKGVQVSQVNPFPFDIESRKAIGLGQPPPDEPEIDSTYRQDFIVFDNPPPAKAAHQSRSGNRPLTTTSWAEYIPDRKVATDHNPFDFSVRGRVSDRLSTDYRDNYVNFMARETVHELDDY